MKIAAAFCIYFGATALVTMFVALVHACPSDPCTLSYTQALMDVAPYTISIAIIVGILQTAAILLATPRE